MEARSRQIMLVTGGAKRLGRGIAVEGARRGFDVAIHYRSSAAAADRLAEEIRQIGVKSVTIRGDLADPTVPKGILETARRKLGKVSLLVNSASIFRSSGLMDFSMEELDEEIRVNAFSPLLLCREIAAQDAPGAIVNLLDSRMNSYDDTHVAYHLSKRMLYDLTRMLAIELAPQIRVNAVAPGLILPPDGADADYLETHKTENPLGRHGSVDEIARAVFYLATSPFVTGQTIFVDGGRHLNSSVYG